MESFLMPKADGTAVHTSDASRELREHGARVHDRMRRQFDDGSTAILDSEGVVVCWYPGAGDRGRDGSPVLGRHVDQFYTASDVANALSRRHLDAVTVRGHSTQSGWRISAAGRLFWAITDIRRVMGHGGALAGFVHVIRPVVACGEPAREMAPRPWSSSGAHRASAYATGAVAA